MNYLDKLEYRKVLDILSTYCVSSKAKELAQYLLPSNDKTKVESLLKETSEATNIIYRCSMPPINDIQNKECEKALKVLESYGILSMKAILNLNKLLKSAKELREYFYQDFIDINEYPILNEIFSKLYTNIGIIEKVSKSIVDENTIDDNASKELLLIRRKQKNMEQNIKQKLNEMIHSSHYAKYIQESLVTIRNDRYVIPVKEEYRSQIKGFIHDISSSGSTVFIEPTAVFELNNEIGHLKIEENLEIEKILQNLSKMFYPYIKELTDDIENLTKLDFIFAKAKYAKDLDAKEPKINNKKQIVLEQARHPLIDKKQVVPISITLGKDFQILVITGPNTGGKTVTLKTVGLLTCMACSGLHIPAKSTSSIYVYDYIFADIGDDQSIANSLSTFSAHMRNIVNIVNLADDKSLILLDELGSGTDPIEGQALAISILEYLKSKGANVISTTHYEELKKYALVTKDFENASVEFDVETLTPTYKLIIGIPGKSNAFEISKKLGLKEDIINKSKQRITKNDIDFEEIIKNIYDSQKEIEEKKNKISEDLDEVERLKEQLQIQNDKKQEQEKEIIQNAKIEARNILLKAKEEANDIIKSMNEIKKHEKDTNKNLNELRSKLNASIKKSVSNSQEIQIDEKEIIQKSNQIKPNSVVYSKSFQKEGVVISHVSKESEVVVQFGSIKMSLPIADLEIKNQSKNSNKSQVNLKSQSKAKNATTEINVIGLNVEEAIFVIDKFIDDSSLAKLSQIRIIHGKGTGKLRKGIHQYLKNNVHVKSYRLGTYGEGEDGVTVVEL